MKVRDIMTTDVVTASPDTTLKEIAIMMRDDDTGAIPVVDGDDLAGIITDRDIVIRCIAAGKDPADVTADEIVTDNLETVEPADDVREASLLMSDKQIRRLPVVENGRLVGMLSLGDIVIKESEGAAGEALESVSRGVKPAGQRRMAAQASKRPPVRAHAEEQPERPRRKRAAMRQDQERGESRMIAGGTRGRQGISNRDIAEERQRQKKVVPIRNAGKTTRRRRAS